MSPLEAVAAVFAEARGCNDAGSAKTECDGKMPCPFCHWTAEAEEESGCFFWAQKAILAMLEGDFSAMPAYAAGAWSRSNLEAAVSDLG